MEISVLSRLIEGIQRNVELATNTLVVSDIKIGGASGSILNQTILDKLILINTAADADGTFDTRYRTQTELSSTTGPSGASLIGVSTAAVNHTPATQDVEAYLASIDSALSTAGGTDFLDSVFRISDDGDDTKKIAFQASAISTATVRTISMPDADVDLGLIASAIQANGSVTFTANQSMGGFKLTNVDTPTNPGDAANKGYVDAALAGLDFQPDVDDVVADASATAPGTGLPAAALGQRYILQTNTASLNVAWGTIAGVEDNDIVEFDGTDWFVAYDVSVQGEGALVWDRDQNVFVRWDGTSWAEFGGLAGVTAGAGLSKSGNTLDIELDTDSGLEFDVPGDAGLLRVQVDSTDDTIERSASGIRVKDGSIDDAKIAAAAGIAFTKLAALTADRVAITDGSGFLTNAANATPSELENLRNATNADSLHSHARIVKSMVAGESFLANTTYAVRMAVDGETAGRIYAADYDASASNEFYVIGVIQPTAAVSAGDTVQVIISGEIDLLASDTAFAAAEIGQPVHLLAAGAWDAVSQITYTTNQASYRIGMIMTTSKILIGNMQLNGIA